jgi:2-(1,2-epoxy-1,2-dihydrophenyl)acetyl-CoA isomerase
VDELRVERSETGVVTLTLNRPELRNAISEPMWEELRRIFHEVAQRDADRVLVVTGAGSAFCSGADLGGDPLPTRHGLAAMHAVNAAALALHDLPKPAIAKVNGVAAGAGMNLALGCDLVVAARSARFSQVFARRGLSVDFGGSWLLPRLVGLHRAKELALLGDVLSADEALALGVLNRVVPDEELDAFVAGWAERLAQGPPIALRLTKRMLTAGLSLGLHEALQWEAAAQTVNFASRDTREGIAAFVQKRAPLFEGR